jgi:lipopolysaccharide assembly outer membrane protein LptD (OstA)
MRLTKSSRPLRGGVTVLAALGLLGVALRAQTPPGQKEPAREGGSYFYIQHADTSRRTVTPAGAVWTCSGNVEFTYEDTTLRTDAATYNEKTQVARSPGKLQIDDAQNTITGARGVAYYKTRKAEIAGNVRIVARPRPGDQSAPEGSLRREFKDPVTIICDRVDYNWRTRTATATGNLTFRQKDRTVTAERAVYEGRTEKVTLTGDVRGFDKTDDVRADSAVVVLREGAESLELINVKGRFRIENEEEGSAPPDPAAPGAPAAPPEGTAPVPPVTVPSP